MFWRLHEAIFKERLAEASSLLSGDTVQWVRGAFTDDAPAFVEGAGLCITTLQDAKNLFRRNYPTEPWLYYEHEKFKASHYLSYVEVPKLNENAIFLPAACITPERVQHLGEKLFVRPNSGNKVFTGFSTTAIVEDLMPYNLDKDTMCVIAPHQEIGAVEYRFWICNGRLIGESVYFWEEIGVQSVPGEVRDMAARLAGERYQISECYVADFAITNAGLVKLVEINALSTSGIYQVDLGKYFSELKAFCLNCV